MNEVRLIGKFEIVKIQDRGSWVTCGVLIKNDDGLDTWFDVKGINKTGKEMEWLPRLEGNYCLVSGRMTSYQNKTGDTVYGLSASKGGLQKLPESVATDLIGQNWSGQVLVSGKVEGAKTNDSGEHFLKLGVRYVIPNPKEGAPNFGTYFVRVRCPENFPSERFEEGSYATVLGALEKGPDKKPMVKAVHIG